MKVDRTAVTNPKVSFREKWKQHLERRGHRNPREVATQLVSPQFVNRHAHRLNQWSPVVLAVIFFGTAAYGVLFAMPELYSDCVILRFMQVVAGFIIIQVMGHWYLTRITTSVFNPDVQLSHDAGNGMSSGQGCKITQLHKNVDDRISLDLGVDNAQSQGDFGLLDKIPADNERNEAMWDFTSYLQTNVPPDVDGASTTSTGQRDERASQIAVTLPVSDNVQCSGPPKHVNEHGEQSLKHNYWSWTMCHVCQRLKPPRCHHCPLCSQCVLKKDHHCYFTGACIGVNNQRHFCAFMFWGVMVTCFGTLHMYPYIYYSVLPNISYLDFIPFMVLFRGILGYTDRIMILLCILFWGLNMFTIFAVVFLYQIVNGTVRGVTNYELHNQIKVLDTRSVQERLRDTWGENWGLNFLIPIKRQTKCYEDAVAWPHIKLG